MRDLIILCEAISAGQKSYWFNPETNETIPAHDHGETVMYNAEKFGIGDDIVDEMEEAFPFGCEEEEDTDHETPEEKDAWVNSLPSPPEAVGSRQGNDRNNAWEQLGMCAGWVRVGESVAFGGGTASAAYFSGDTPERIWKTVRFVSKRGGVGDRIEIELCPGYDHKGEYLTIAGDDLERYLKSSAIGKRVFATS
jgi:hypothetical protein